MSPLSTDIAVSIAVAPETIGGETINSVDARELHRWLDVGRDFSNWMRKRIREYGFVEGEDYSPVLANNTGKRGQPRTEYILTIDMAKELAMVERNERGRQARRYFIECERRLRQNPPLSEEVMEKAAEAATYALLDPATLREVLLAHIDVDERKRVAARVKEMMHIDTSAARKWLTEKRSRS